MKAEDKSDDLPDAPILEPIKEMPTLASAGPNVEMTLEKMPAPEQPEGDDGGGQAPQGSNGLNTATQNFSFTNQMNALQNKNSKSGDGFRFKNEGLIIRPDATSVNSNKKLDVVHIDILGLPKFKIDVPERPKIEPYNQHLPYLSNTLHSSAQEEAIEDFFGNLSKIVGAFSFGIAASQTVMETGASLQRGVSITKLNNVSYLRALEKSGTFTMKLLARTGLVCGGIGAYISGRIVYQQYQKGGWAEVGRNRAWFDITVGVVGTAAPFLIASPVGWGIAGAAAIYGVATLMWDVYHEPKK